MRISDWSSDVCSSDLSGAFAQISLAIATYYDSRVLENIKQHEIAVRSAVLMRLADQDEAELSPPEVKERLQAELKTAVNEVLSETAGFVGFTRTRVVYGKSVSLRVILVVRRILKNTT